jgi:16S rRNA (uracil1498-N3)-methyltransferase
MAARRIVVPEGSLAIGETEIPEDDAIHLRDVLRLRPGAPLLLSDGAGREAAAEIVEVSRRSVRVNVRRIEQVKERSGTALSLLQCVGKGDKMDQVVRQATELGVREIVPVISERAVARREARIDRLKKVAEDAIRVSSRAYRPRIERVISLEEALARPRAELALTFAIDAETSLGVHLDRIIARPSSAEVLIGPEGGLTPEELARATAAGFAAVNIGPHTLRTETAGPAVAAMILFWARAIGW